MSAPRCKPGDLALVIRGRQRGKSVTVLAPATEEEVLENIYKVLGVRFGGVMNRGQLWKVDLPITWSGLGHPDKVCMVAQPRMRISCPLLLTRRSSRNRRKRSQWYERRGILCAL